MHQPTSRPAIVNIINFIRALEPRVPSMDLLEPVSNQIRLVQQNRLAATWLIQYDALLDNRFVSLLKNELDDRQEIGAWFEVVQPLVEKAGLVWRGRYPWDWHAHVGFSIGYTPLEREKLTDIFLEEFKSVFGNYPRSVGSWLMDAHLLAYLQDRYNVVSSCNCKDQWGTDGYTLWGGYFNQAYYPSRKNAFVPAQHVEHQIPLPIFRMLGSDPIYQYDTAINEGGSQGVLTLEPVCQQGGGSPAWVRWFFDVNFKTPCLSFGYAQVGQENGFSWPTMAEGFLDQINLLAEKVANNELSILTLGDAGEWFRKTYSLTPTSVVTALADWRNEDRRSVWYCSRFYRVNFYWEGECFWIRDLHLFDDEYEERYLKATCQGENCTYDTLPLVDGLCWSSPESRAGLYPMETLRDGTKISLVSLPPIVTEVSDDDLLISCPLKSEGAFEILCRPDELRMHCGELSWSLELQGGQRERRPVIGFDHNTVQYKYNGHAYQLVCSKGRISSLPEEHDILFFPDENDLVFSFNPGGRGASRAF